MKSNLFPFLAVIVLSFIAINLMTGCSDQVRWNEELNRCQQVSEPYQIVASERCGK